jgi:hypothetical protein
MPGFAAGVPRLARAMPSLAFRAHPGGLADRRRPEWDADLGQHGPALSRFRVGDPFGPWLLRIVANETKNLTR